MQISILHVFKLCKFTCVCVCVCGACINPYASSYAKLQWSWAVLWHNVCAWWTYFQVNTQRIGLLVAIRFQEENLKIPNPPSEAKDTLLLLSPWFKMLIVYMLYCTVLQPNPFCVMHWCISPHRLGCSLYSIPWRAATGVKARKPWVGNSTQQIGCWFRDVGNGGDQGKVWVTDCVRPGWARGRMGQITVAVTSTRFHAPVPGPTCPLHWNSSMLAKGLV